MSTVNGSLKGYSSYDCMQYTTIALTKSTRDAVAAIGSKDQSFEEILQELIKKWNEKVE